METICLAADIMGSDAYCATQEDFDLINMMLLIKDKHCISGRGYHEMASVCKEMPRHYKLKRRIKELNSLWNITPAPNGILGVQQSLEDRLFIRVSRLLKTTPEMLHSKKMGLSESNFLEMGHALVRDYTSLTSHSLSYMKAR